MKHLPDQRRLSSYSAEFISKATEKAFLRSSWINNKTVTRNTLSVLLFLITSFVVRDMLEVEKNETILILLLIRILLFCLLSVSIVVIHRAENYFDNYHHLLSVNQVLLFLGVMVITLLREVHFSFIGVNTILFTLICYQFINNRFYSTLTICIVAGVGAVLAAILFLEMTTSDIIASVLFLIPLNILGIIILRSINRSRRQEFLAIEDLKQANAQKEKAIQELQESLAEVKTLRGFLPICSQCKKIRDDEGYWNQIETYIEQHSDAKFSHSICRQCSEKLYGNEQWYKQSIAKQNTNNSDPNFRTKTDTDG